MDKKEARRRRRKKKSRLEIAKFLIGAVLLIGIIGSSVSITFASQDVQSLLTSWFDTQRGHAIEEIKGAIDAERETQTKRLKEELQSEIQLANEQLQTFTEDEKVKRTTELRRYTDELINQFSVDHTEEENSVKNELERIYQNAVMEMEQIMNNRIPHEEPVEDPQPEVEGEPIEEPTPEKEPVVVPSPEPNPDEQSGKDNSTDKEGDA